MVKIDAKELKPKSVFSPKNDLKKITSSNSKVSETNKNPLAHSLLKKEVINIVDLVGKRKEVSKQLKQVERQIYSLEKKYLEQTNPYANALNGYESLLFTFTGSSRKATLKPEDKIFSGSSVTGQDIK